MTFTDLPDGWKHRPLDDPALAVHVVDLFVSEADRASGALALLLCGPDRSMRAPVVIGDADDRVPVAERDELLGHLLEAIGPALGGLVAAVARPGAAVPTDDDRAWHQCLIAACRASGVPLLGTYLAVPGRVEELPVARPLVA